MGAVDFIRTMPGDLSHREVMEEIAKAREYDLHENGHSGYTGSLGSMGGGAHFKGRSFGTLDEATEWLMDNHEKWDPPWVVEVIQSDTHPKGLWVYGGWAPS